MKIIFILLLICFLCKDIQTCSLKHETDNHCDHIYRTCMRYTQEINHMAGICLTTCYACKGLSRKSLFKRKK